MNVVLYMRYSSDRQTEQSIEGQSRICRDFCERMGYNIVGTYIDRAISAYHDSAKRVEFNKMIADAEKHQWQGVVVYKLDRFARNRYDSATFKARLKKHGVRLISATENISDNPEGVLLEAVLEGMAEFYSKELSQKVSRGMDESAAKCQSVGGRIPLGYKVVDKKYVVDEEKAPWVREAFEMYADGATVMQICNRFNALGRRTVTGVKFNKNSFNKMFNNKRYLGIYTYKDIEVKGGIPQIIPDDLFERVAVRMKINASSPQRGKAIEDYVLTGKLFCGHCKSPMTGKSGTSRNGDKYLYYVCKGREDGCCHKSWLKKQKLEYYVAQSVQMSLNEETIDQLVKAAVKYYEDEVVNGSTIPQLRKEVEQTEKAIANLLDMVQVSGASAMLANRLNELEEQKRQLSAQLAIEEKDFVELDENKIRWWLSRFQSGDIDDFEYRRRLIDTFVVSVYVSDDKDDNGDDIVTLDIVTALSGSYYNTVSWEDVSSTITDPSTIEGVCEHSMRIYCSNSVWYLIRRMLRMD